MDLWLSLGIEFQASFKLSRGTEILTDDICWERAGKSMTLLLLFALFMTFDTTDHRIILDCFWELELGSLYYSGSAPNFQTIFTVCIKCGGGVVISWDCESCVVLFCRVLSCLPCHLKSYKQVTMQVMSSAMPPFHLNQERRFQG